MTSSLLFNIVIQLSIFLSCPFASDSDNDIYDKNLNDNKLVVNIFNVIISNLPSIRN